MTAINISNKKFRNSLGVYGFLGSKEYAIYVENKGYISFDGENVYRPAGGLKACKAIISGGIDLNNVYFVNSIEG